MEGHFTKHRTGIPQNYIVRSSKTKKSGKLDVTDKRSLRRHGYQRYPNWHPRAEKEN